MDQDEQLRLLTKLQTALDQHGLLLHAMSTPLQTVDLILDRLSREIAAGELDNIERKIGTARGSLKMIREYMDALSSIRREHVRRRPKKPSSTDSLPEHAVVRLLHDLPADGLKAGETGTVVHVYNEGASYEVDFITGRQRPKLVTVEPGDIELAESN